MSLIAFIATGAALLILGAIALTLVWTVVGVESDVTEMDAEVADRQASGPVRVHPADDLTRIASAVTDAKGRAL